MRIMMKQKKTCKFGIVWMHLISNYSISVSSTSNIINWENDFIGTSNFQIFQKFPMENPTIYKIEIQVY